MIPNYYMYGDFFDFEGLIFKTGKRVALEKHSPIKQFNEPADKFYYVRSGLVRAVVLHSDGNEKALYVAADVYFRSFPRMVCLNGRKIFLWRRIPMWRQYC
jgi:CRP-like cAMP-binding protein